MIITPVNERHLRQAAGTSPSFAGKRIAIFDPYPDFATNPTLVALSRSLSDAGAEVDIFMPGHRRSRYPDIDGLGTRWDLPYRPPFWRGDLRASLRGWGRGAHDLPARRRFNRHFAAAAYDLIIGIDCDGVIEAQRVSMRADVPFAHLSFELLFSDELTSEYERRLKAAERAASQAASLVIVQDPERARLLIDENQLDPSRIVLLPVSPSGRSIARHSGLLRTMHGISPDQTVVLHSGAFGDWTYADELIRSASSWPDGFVLVVHTKYRPGRNDRFVEEIRARGASNVVLSTEPLGPDDYDEMVASADLGLVLYKPVPGSPLTQRNIRCIGLASGKFSSYLRAGVPVVSVAQQTYAELLTDYDFGANIDAIDALPRALESLRTHLDWHSAEASRLFAERLDFDIHWPTIARSLRETMERS
jgi:hypothetical protein